jgi:plasmid maintenance system killer protein
MRLAQIANVFSLEGLKLPKSNKLEKLFVDRGGHHGIRVYKQ